MTTATVTSKGQITIPADVRRALAVDAGDRVEFVQIESGQYLFMAGLQRQQSPDDDCVTDRSRPGTVGRQVGMRSFNVEVTGLARLSAQGPCGPQG